MAPAFQGRALHGAHPLTKTSTEQLAQPYAVHAALCSSHLPGWYWVTLQPSTCWGRWLMGGGIFKCFPFHPWAALSCGCGFRMRRGGILYFHSFPPQAFLPRQASSGRKGGKRRVGCAGKRSGKSDNCHFFVISLGQRIFMPAPGKPSSFSNWGEETWQP